MAKRLIVCKLAGKFWAPTLLNMVRLRWDDNNITEGQNSGIKKFSYVQTYQNGGFAVKYDMLLRRAEICIKW